MIKFTVKQTHLPFDWCMPLVPVATKDGMPWL